MTWAQTSWFWALPAIAVLVALMAWFARRHVARLGQMFRGAALERVLPKRVRARRLVRDVLWVAGLISLVVALAEPRFGKRKHQVDAEGVDLVLAVDLSRSMDATDVDPSRLERARREILDLIDKLEGDRVGLVIFAGGAYPRMPLTADRRALEMIVSELDTQTFQAQGSNVAEALREGTKLLSKGTSDAGRAILLLSDGEIHEPGDALAAAQEATNAGVVVFGMVVGQAAAPIPNGDGTFLKDPSTGDRVMTTPSDAVLTDLARATGGAVVRSVPGDEDTKALVSEMRSTLKSVVTRSERLESWESAVGWPLGLGVLLLMLSAWLGDGRKVVATLVMALLLVGPAAHAQESAAAGDAAYRAGRYAEAVKVFEQLATQTPTDSDLQGRLGAARYRAGDFDGAARAFDRQSQLSNSADAAYNAGNAWWQSGVLDRALQRYDSALARDPSNESAKANREMVAQEIKQRRSEQQQQQSGGSEQGKPGEDKNDPQQGQQQQGQQGQPQQGEQSQQGQPQQGQQGQPQQGQPQQGQQGQPQQGQPQQGQQGQPQQGQPQQGQQGQPQQGQQGKPQQGQQGQGKPDDNGTRQPGETQGANADGTPQGEGQPGAAGADNGQGDGTQTGQGMTAEQAKKTLDGVEEGRPRVVVPGQTSEKPW